jgi:hypothetical protein
VFKEIKYLKFMALFYKISDKELLFIRNKIIQEVGIHALEKNGYFKSPFSTTWFGRDDSGNFNYELSRISKNHIEIITIYINKGKKWIKMFLNVL